MYGIVTRPLDEEEIKAWLSFKDAELFEPINGNWIPIYMSGRNELETEYGKIEQGFRVFPVLVDSEDVGDLLDIDPAGEIPRFEINGGYELWGDEGKTWQRTDSTEVNGVEVKPLITKLDYEPPMLHPGFIDFHDLVEEEKRDYYTWNSEEPVTRFDFETWKNNRANGSSLEDGVETLDVEVGHLLDYLEATEQVLVLAYFQSRKLKKSNNDYGITEFRENMQINDAPAYISLLQTDGLKEEYPHGEFHYVCPIYPSSSHRRANSEQNKSINFDTKKGYSFSVEEVENKEGFEEKGFERPVRKSKNLQDALSKYDWVFFKMDLLSKYWKNEGSSVVWDSRQNGRVSSKKSLILSIHRNEQDEVAIILDDLYKLPSEEIPHWKAHNIAPKGSIPQEAIESKIMAKFPETKSFKKSVLDNLEALNEIFQEHFQGNLFQEMQESDPDDKLIIPPKNQKEDLLTVMDALNKVFLERLEKSSIENQLDSEDLGDVGGSKDALHKLIWKLEDKETADKLLTPINTLYYLRQDADHRGTSKWEKAMSEMNMENNSNYREIYKEVMKELSNSLDEIASIIDSNQG